MSWSSGFKSVGRSDNRNLILSKGEQMGEEIKKECLSVREDIVFVNYKGGALRTATADFYRRYRDAIWVVWTPKTPAIRELHPGQPLRITY